MSLPVHEYVDARLDAAEARMKRSLDHAVEKVRDEAHETRAWVLLLTAASWGALAQDTDGTRLVAAIVTLGVVAVAGIYLVVRKQIRARRMREISEEERAEIEKDLIEEKA